jgi:hypothetical protein
MDNQDSGFAQPCKEYFSAFSLMIFTYKISIPTALFVAVE